MTNNRRGYRRVIRNSMEKTVVVEVATTKRHPLYKKVIRTSKKYMAHDETNAIPVGALVRIVESRPISKTKKWAVEEVLETGEVVESVDTLDLQAELDAPEEPETEEA